MGAKIRSAAEGSIAQACGIEPGDVLLSVGGAEVRDVLDYRYLTAEEYVELEIEKPDGERIMYEIEKDLSEDLGLEFEKELLDDMKSCRNKCIFCFIDQLPPGMRESLYFKDDDARMSFLMGNYITMTNLSEADLERIIQLHISPVNISVHTTNPELRRFMLRNKNAGDLLPAMRQFAQAGIAMNCQIVACPGVNDGAELDRTLADLSRLFPQVESVSVVPVGITDYREGLHPLRVYERDEAARLMDQVEHWQQNFLKQFGKRYVYLADEFYLLVGREIPSAEEYEDFPQIENGVGMIASLRAELDEALMCRAEEIKRAEAVRKTVACGVIAAPFFRAQMERLQKMNPGLCVVVRAVENRFFGSRVTVSGLVCGGDLIEQLRGENLGEEVLISSNMMKADEDVFLDDVTLGAAEESLNVRVTPVPDSGDALIDAILR